MKSWLQKHSVWSTEHTGKHEATIRKKLCSQHGAENIWTFQAGSEAVTAASFKANNCMLCKTQLAILVPKKTRSSLFWSCLPSWASYHDRERIKITKNKKVLFHFVLQHISTDSDLNIRNNTISGNRCVYRVWKGLSECSIHTNIPFFSHLTTSVFHHLHIQYLCSCKLLEKKICACLYHVWISAACCLNVSALQHHFMMMSSR